MYWFILNIASDNRHLNLHFVKYLT